MDLYAFPPIAGLLDGAHAVLMALAALLEPVIGIASAAAAVVLVTLLVRAALIPVGISQAKAEQTRSRLAPKLAALQKQHKANPERLQRETMKLYGDEGTTPFAGCLPMLVQAPIVGVIYALFILPTIAGHPNALLEQTFFGVPLGSSLAGQIATGTLTPAALVVFGVVIAGIAVVGELTRRVFQPKPPAGGAGGAVATSRADASAPNDPAAASAALLAGPGMARALGALQFITAVIAVFVPLAAALYLFVTVAWTLGQRMLLRRRYPLFAARTA
ncbi:YidC/Oxa1 family membrane protein insertase [Agromyces cerinus]|uniref:Membrane protein insertase YidC n=1 Tax=Agromyces cerinus subsp. cerinus TaxID=232089 RepID=A0A1N6FAP3_9MICO|nr:membrane protein insertase YidC [Agromyces cerinus]SIN92312.1 YidC/Oxa1 family membrane protein insertase [Agromyces cerinus subsp. cerinus]